VNQSALQAAGVQARHIEGLWWLFFWVCVVAYVLVVAATVLAIAHRRRARSAGEETPEVVPSPRRERPLVLVVGVSIGLTVIALFLLLWGDFVTRRELRALASERPLDVRVTGRQWWWEFQYPDSVPSREVTTASELHIPVGRPVRFDLRSADVIHSFWIPSLSGKKDLIPGSSIAWVAQADREGVLGGQCAEFCGLQHATMRFLVIAEEESKFQAWLESQRASAREPATAMERHGRDVFLGSTCAMCHAVQGTPARSRLGPDLTHVGSRLRIASAALPNTREHLRRWIEEPQSIRPGVRMPDQKFDGRDLDALVAYLESLR
jgi:cytochrome c oxidase subunit II